MFVADTFSSLSLISPLRYIGFSLLHCRCLTARIATHLPELATLKSFRRVYDQSPAASFRTDRHPGQRLKRAGGAKYEPDVRSGRNDRADAATDVSLGAMVHRTLPDDFYKSYYARSSAQRGLQY